MDDHKDGWEWYRVRKYYSVAMFSMNPMHLFATIIPWIIDAAVFHFYGITEKQFQSFWEMFFLQIIISSFLTKSNKHEWPWLFCLLLSIIDKDNPLRCTKVSSVYMWTVSVYREYKILSLCHCHFHQLFAILGFASANGRWWMRVLFILVTLSH